MSPKTKSIAQRILDWFRFGHSQRKIKAFSHKTHSTP